MARVSTAGQMCDAVRRAREWVSVMRTRTVWRFDWRNSRIGVTSVVCLSLKLLIYARLPRMTALR